MKQILLTQDKVTLVDDSDYDYLNQWKWCYHNGYAIRNSSRKGIVKVKSSQIFLHHLVIGITRLPIMLELMTDHIDGDKLNNQRYNLRIVTNRINQGNRIEHRKGKLVGTRLMTDHFRVKPWEAHVTMNGKQTYLGYYETAQEAHDAYLNFIKKF